MALDTHPAHHVSHGSRAELFHEVGRYVVGTVGKSPLECHGLSDPFFCIRTAGSPGFATGDLEGLWQVHHLVARGHSLLHCKSVEERLDGRSYLTLALTDIVVLEVPVIRSSDIGLDVTCAGFHRHE